MLLIASLKILLLLTTCEAMTRQQLKSSGRLLKIPCIRKNNVTEEEVVDIDQGKFIESRNFMCYVACIYTMGQMVKDNKLNYDAMIKQVDVMFPPEAKDGAKAATDHCRDVFTNQYDDLCESAYWTAKCVYDYNPANFIFP